MLLNAFKLATGLYRYKAYRDSMTTNSYPYDDKFLPV